ncbi:NOL1/NOP2/sun family putative RNA methylase [Candidatus Woesearchaeota archaeon]|nr:NOL1/NOP2/sun family putative RNA methylase [Candidatus Woesearchaeota archaeon]
MKPGFEKRYRALCSDYDEFMKYSLSFLRRSIRVNTLKAEVSDVKKRLEKKGWILTSIPWCKEGFWLDHVEGRRDIGNTEEHMLGYIYVQGAASMLPPLVLEPKPGERTLDMCASPGSKSSQMAAMMKDTGVLVCNDYKGMRARPLGINLQRMGSTNTIVSLMEGQRIKDMEFDKILVDAPCSGTGTIRKSLKTLRMYNENMVKRLSATQRQLIDRAFNLLKPGGVMVYSTCTLEPHENEAVVSCLLDKYPNAKVMPIKISIERRDPILEFEGDKYNPQVKDALRIWPQDNDTEGFFVCKIKKD